MWKSKRNYICTFVQTNKFVPKTEYGLLCFPDPCKQQHCAGLQSRDPLRVTNPTVWIEQDVSVSSSSLPFSLLCWLHKLNSEHRKEKHCFDRTLNLTLTGLCQMCHCPWHERHCKLRMNFSLTRKNLALYYPYCPTTPYQPVPLSPVTPLYFQWILRQP